MAIHAAAQRKPEGLEVERRTERDAIEVSLPFVLTVAGRSLTGARLSLQQVTVEADMRAMPEGEFEAALHVQLDGFNVAMALVIAPSPSPANVPGQWRFDIVDLRPETGAALAQLVRSSLSGWLPNADDLALGWDEETPQQPAVAISPRRTSIQWIMLGLGLLAAVLGLIFASQQAYFLFATVPLESAAVTSQRLDIISPEYGEVAAGAALPGTTVQPGDTLIRVASDTLSAAIDLEQVAQAETSETDRRPGRLAALERRLKALSFSSRCTCTVLWAASPGIAVAPGALLMSLVVSDPADIRVEAWVPPRVAPEVRPGQQASVTFSGDPKTYPATVEGVSYDTSPIAKIGLMPRGDMATVSLRLDDPAAGLVPGRPATGVIFK